MTLWNAGWRHSDEQASATAFTLASVSMSVIVLSLKGCSALNVTPETALPTRQGLGTNRGWAVSRLGATTQHPPAQLQHVTTIMPTSPRALACSLALFFVQLQLQRGSRYPASTAGCKGSASMSAGPATPCVAEKLSGSARYEKASCASKEQAGSATGTRSGAAAESALFVRCRNTQTLDRSTTGAHSLALLTAGPADGAPAGTVLAQDPPPATCEPAT